LVPVLLLLLICCEVLLNAALDNLVLGGFLLLPVLLSWQLCSFFLPRKDRPPHTTSHLIAGNALVFVWLCSLGLLAGEIWFRFVSDTTQVTDSTKSSKRWFQRHWKPNALGFRDSIDYSPFRVSGKRRTSFIGDSFTAGHGVEVQERFANRYRARRPEQEVHVLAEIGLDTGGELTLLDDLLDQGYQLDQVVLCYYLNDIADLSSTAHDALEVYRSQPNFLCQHSYFLNTLYWRFTLAHDPYAQDYFDAIVRSYEDSTWEKQKQRLAALHRLVRDARGRLAVVTFPFLNYGPNYRGRVAHERLATFWKEQGVPHLDLLPVFEPYPARDLIVNPFDAHPNAKAHALAADAITEFLDQLAPSKGP
jgi:lysophospholipase L1-like esterase